MQRGNRTVQEARLGYIGMEVVGKYTRSVDDVEASSLPGQGRLAFEKESDLRDFSAMRALLGSAMGTA